MTFPACSPAVLLVAVLAVPAARTATTNPVADPIRFDRDVKPLLAKHCLACHGPDKQRADLRLDRKADALRGGESGKLIVPGKPAESLLVQRVTATDDTRMPPTGDGLTPAEVARLKAWIEQGADWPDDGSAAANPADWWSFRPIRKPAVPPGVHPIDALIRAKLRDLKLSPSPAADRRTLIRRLYFDLIGLPPTPAEIEAFLNDKSPTAYEQLVDRLLASPHYGERWARHWLDVVHYGETHGYDKDKPRPHAWPYRDYVIRAFNTDKPYARFVQEQIAGDVLFPGTVDGIEALGFLAAGPWDFIGHVELPESKIDGKVARHLDRDDFVSNTIGTFVGLTIHCAQCHHHKFDPITQDDYYALQAVFAAIDRTERTYDADPAVAARRAELEAALRTARNRITTLHRDALAQADPELQTVLQQLEAGRQPATDTKPPEFGYHSEIAPKPDVTKWVQVDLGASTKLERIVLRPCHDDFNNIGAGFGFPPRFRVELSDDPLFQSGVVLVATVDERTADVPRATTAPLVVRAEGKAGRYLRVTATRLAPRRDDFIFALAELEAFDAAGKNRAAGQPVTALDSIEAPVRWAKGNLTDGKFPPRRGSRSLSWPGSRRSGRPC
jgi:cytochrome c553